MPKRLAQTVSDLMIETSEAAMHSAVTISARLPIFAEHSVSPTASGLAELHRACSEKVAAGWEGAFAAGSAWQSMMMRAMVSPLTPLGMAQASLVLARLPAGPAHRRVRANARRLG